MRPALLACVLVLVGLALCPVPARAATSSDCSVSVDTFAKDLETNTTMVDDLARPNDPSPDHVAQSAARYNREAAYYATLCPSSKKIYADALLTTWQAWVEHATTHENPAQTTELAARKLQKCSVAYSGTDEAATCATWAEQLAKWQTQWASP